jgi:hypothetical protein
MKRKKKRIQPVPRTPDPSETLIKKERHELPAVLTRKPVVLPSRSEGRLHIGQGTVLPRVFEWTIVPGPDEVQ